jgi:hypothetical protein
MEASSGSADSNKSGVLPDVSTKKTKSPFTLSPITKKKYNAIKENVEKEYGKEVADFVCQKICDVFEFDPVVGNYAKEKVQKHQEWREKRSKELGVTQKDLRKGVKNLLLAT